LKVFWGKKVNRQLKKIPNYIEQKFYAWVLAVEIDGIRETRKQPGFHDEPVKSNRRGHRSVRLNRSYRAFYRETHKGNIELIEVLEVNNHDY
jgi:proteic killer suppression protein